MPQLPSTISSQRYARSFRKFICVASICVISVNERAFGINIRLCELSIKSVYQVLPFKLLKAMALHNQDPRVLLGNSRKNVTAHGI